MHAGPGDGLIAIHEVFAFPETIQEYRHSTDIQAMRAKPHEVIEDTGDLVEQHPYILSPDRRFNPEQALDGQHVCMLIAHHGHVIEPIHITDTLVIGLALGQLFGGPVQEPDMGIGPLDDLAIHLQHQAQYTMSGWMLGAEIQGHIAYFRHRGYS